MNRYDEPAELTEVLQENSWNKIKSAKYNIPVTYQCSWEQPADMRMSSIDEFQPLQKPNFDRLRQGFDEPHTRCAFRNERKKP